MCVSPTNNKNSCFIANNPRLTLGVTITTLALLLILGLVLIVGGLLGFLPFLSGVIAGSILIALTLSVVAFIVFRLVSCKLGSSEPTIEDLIEEYRKDRYLSQSIPYRIIYAENMDDSSGWLRQFDYNNLTTCYDLAECDPPIIVDIVNDEKEIIAIVVKDEA